MFSFASFVPTLGFLLGDAQRSMRCSRCGRSSPLYQGAVICCDLRSLLLFTLPHVLFAFLTATRSQVAVFKRLSTVITKSFPWSVFCSLWLQNILFTVFVNTPLVIFCLFNSLVNLLYPCLPFIPGFIHLLPKGRSSPSCLIAFL